MFLNIWTLIMNESLVYLALWHISQGGTDLLLKFSVSFKTFKACSVGSPSLLWQANFDTKHFITLELQEGFSKGELDRQ